MKVLMATQATQGARARDFTDCISGELVWMLDPCPASRRNPNGPCGCGRSFTGMSSDGSTTTAVVCEIADFSRADYEKALSASFDAKGWCPCCYNRTVAEYVDDLVAMAGPWPPGAVIGRRLDVLSLRAQLGPSS
jgi:hypothetical protein